MKLILEYEEFRNRESLTRTKKLTDKEFLDTLRDNCKNFSFDNDILWRGTNSYFGKYGLYFEAERKNTIGNYSYKDFFDKRKDYVVPRYKSLIGSTTKMGAEYLSSDMCVYMVIPFDNAKIVFAGAPDLALWAKVKQKFTDELFILDEYTDGFKVKESELNSILMKSNLASYIEKVKIYGFEFFTNENCLLLAADKVDWLKENL